MSAEEILARILEARGYKTNSERERFLNPSYEDHLHDPFLLNDMDKAVKRLLSALDKSEKVIIYGDYDVDGLTASAVLGDGLGAMGLDTGHYLPNRFSEGYGLSKVGMDAVKKMGAKVALSVDCGSLSFDEAKYAKSIGLDLIITDHHTINPELPEALAVINPKRHDSKYPFKELAGVGVAFKLVQAMQSKNKSLKAGQEKWLLDLVALGTVCDIVSLTDENRVLVKWGLEVMKRTRRAGLKALANVSGVELSEVNEFDLGYRFGPRLNAAGRMDSAQDSLDLLLANTDAEAMRIAMKLNASNQRRQSDQEKIFNEAIQQADEFEDDRVLVLSSPDWSHGIVGIVASKITEKKRKPTFILQELGDKSKGSARSFGVFKLDKAINSIRSDLITGGGHGYAAGITIETKKVPEIRKKLNDLLSDKDLANSVESLNINADLNLDAQVEMGMELAGLLDSLRPFGQDNRQPVFDFDEFEVVDSRPVGKDQSHLKLRIRTSGGEMDGIGFSLYEKFKMLDKEGIKLRGCLEINKFNGQISPQIRIIDIQ